MNIEMIVSQEDIDDDALHELTLDLAQSINAETAMNASLPEIPAAVGSRGDMAEIGKILLTLVTSGAMIELLRVIHAKIRHPKMTFTFKQRDQEITLTGEDLTEEQIDRTLKLMSGFIADDE